MRQKRQEAGAQKGNAFRSDPCTHTRVGWGPPFCHRHCQRATELPCCPRFVADFNSWRGPPTQGSVLSEPQACKMGGVHGFLRCGRGLELGTSFAWPPWAFDQKDRRAPFCGAGGVGGAHSHQLPKPRSAERGSRTRRRALPCRKAATHWTSKRVWVSCTVRVVRTEYLPLAAPPPFRMGCRMLRDIFLGSRLPHA